MPLDAMLAYRCVAVVGLVATLCAAQEAQWLQLEARPVREAVHLGLFARSLLLRSDL